MKNENCYISAVKTANLINDKTIFSKVIVTIANSQGLTKPDNYITIGNNYTEMITYASYLNNSVAVFLDGYNVTNNFEISIKHNQLVAKQIHPFLKPVISKSINEVVLRCIFKVSPNTPLDTVLGDKGWSTITISSETHRLTYHP